MDDPVLVTMRAGLAYGERIMAGIPAGAHHLRTPCEEFDVEGLVDHLIQKVVAFGCVGDRETTDPEQVPMPSGRHRIDSYRAAAGRVRSAWTPTSLRETFHLAQGNLTGIGLTRFFLLEVLGHGWDLAVATGQEADAGPALACAGLGATDAIGDVLRTAGALAPPVIVPPTVSLMDRFVAAIGRDPGRWRGPDAT